MTLEVDEDMITAAIETKEDTYHVEVGNAFCVMLCLNSLVQLIFAIDH